MVKLLTTEQMAEFASSGCLFFDELIDKETNKEFLDDIGHTSADKVDSMQTYNKNIKATSSIPRIKAGSPLKNAYPVNSPLEKILKNEVVAGAIQSLVGSNPVVDHQALHLTFPSKFFKGANKRQMSQGNHQDSTIDPRSTFDIQVFYFPTEVTKEMGGTRYHPGTHLRIVNEFAIAKYQNILGQRSIVCKPGTIGIFHNGLWHGAGVNFSDEIRYMFKVRLQPTEKQELLWDPEKKYKPLPNRALYWTDENKEETINDILMQSYPWQEADTNRLDKINVVKFWRLLTGHKKMDVDYWLTRIENKLY
tara:strand:+ start:664 stop:1584 length:921 start_codon:yes stop_codon:yes gene_type:complete